MSFGPWMNSEDEIDYVSSATEETLTAWDEHTQWKLVSASVSRKQYNIVSKDKKYVTKFPNLIYYFVIERHSSLITKTIIGWSIACYKSNWSRFIVLGASFILMSINVFALFVGIELNERLSLLAVNILLHFQIIHQVSWMLPYGDTVPRTSKLIKWKPDQTTLTQQFHIFQWLSSEIHWSSRVYYFLSPSWSNRFLSVNEHHQLGFKASFNSSNKNTWVSSFLKRLKMMKRIVMEAS